MNSLHAPSRGQAERPLTSSLNEMVVTIWACASFYIMYATGGNNEYPLILPLIGGAVVLILMTFRQPVIARVDPLLSVGVFLLIFAILASYLFNAQRYEPVFIAGNVVSTALLFIALYTITTKINLDFRKTFFFTCLFSTPLFPVILATSRLQWGRVMPAELTPNYVCMMALVCLIGACCARSWIWALFLSALPLYTIVVMESRDAMLSAGIALGIMGWSHGRRLGLRKLRPYLLVAGLGIPTIAIALMLLGVPVLGFADDIFERLFMLSDEHRGIGSGASGRTELWNAAINLWLSHPIFGVGFKGHRWMMPDQMYAHSAYIGILADTGLVGFSAYLLIVGVAIYHILKRGDRGLPELPLRAAILFSYIVYGVLESRAFSLGNSYSVLFLLVVFDSSKHYLRKTGGTAPLVPPVIALHGPMRPDLVASVTGKR